MGDAVQVASAFAKARERLGPVAILVNNAGQAETAPLARMPVELWQRMLAVNLTGTFLCAQAAVPDAGTARAGRIVNIASTAALQNFATAPRTPRRSTACWGCGRSRSSRGPGHHRQRAVPENDRDRHDAGGDRQRDGAHRPHRQARAYFASQNPQERIDPSPRVAAAVLWLCGDAAAGVNGAAIPISGGAVR